MKPVSYSTLLMVALISGTAAFTNIRVANFQAEDITLLALVAYCLIRIANGGFGFALSRPAARYFNFYFPFFLVLIFFSFLSIRMPFFPLEHMSLLKKPILFSVSRLIQLIAVVCGFLWITDKFIRNKQLLHLALKAYWIVGVLAAAYSIACYLILAFLKFPTSNFIYDLWGAYSNHYGVPRARGFFNEGGPFGIYLLSVIIVGLLLRRVTAARISTLSMLLIAAAFCLSSSKAGFCAIILIVAYLAFSSMSWQKMLGFVVAMTLVLALTAHLLHFDDQAVGYYDSYQNMEQKVGAATELDPNLFLGRVAALYIVPRMIQAHPWTGIGFGNYPLMRNDPRYRGYLPAVTHLEDLPGIGIPAMMAEIGIPATLLLLFFLLGPYFASRHNKSWILRVAALFQFTAHMFAVQLTFFYPWFVSACALAILYHESDPVFQTIRNTAGHLRTTSLQPSSPQLLPSPGITKF